MKIAKVMFLFATMFTGVTLTSELLESIAEEPSTLIGTVKLNDAERKTYIVSETTIVSDSSEVIQKCMQDNPTATNFSVTIVVKDGCNLVTDCKVASDEDLKASAGSNQATSESNPESDTVSGCENQPAASWCTIS